MQHSMARNPKSTPNPIKYECVPRPIRRAEKIPNARNPRAKGRSFILLPLTVREQSFNISLYYITSISICQVVDPTEEN